MSKKTDLADFLASCSYPLVSFSSIGHPAGKTYAHFEDVPTEYPDGWLTLEGTVDDCGVWNWDGEDDPRDFQRNSVLWIVAKSSENMWIQLREDYITANGEVRIGNWEGELSDIAHLMDDDLREKIHGEGVDSDWEFVERYLEEHFEKFGELFRVN